MSGTQELCMDSLIDAFSLALAESKTLADLAKETQPNGVWRVYDGFDMGLKPENAPTPAIVILPQSDSEAADNAKELVVFMLLVLRDNKHDPSASANLIKHAAPGIAMRWKKAIKNTLEARIHGTDAKALYMTAQYDFSSLSVNNLMTCTFTVTVPLPRGLGFRRLLI